MNDVLLYNVAGTSIHKAEYATERRNTADSTTYFCLAFNWSKKFSSSSFAHSPMSPCTRFNNIGVSVGPMHAVKNRTLSLFIFYNRSMISKITIRYRSACIVYVSIWGRGGSMVAYLFQRGLSKYSFIEKKKQQI